MVNAGGHQTRTLADKWTVVTADGQRSAHVEDTVAITAEGPLVLTLIRADGELIKRRGLKKGLDYPLMFA